MEQSYKLHNVSSQSGSDDLLDQKQLGQYTLGSRLAEETILALFQRQSSILLKRLRKAASTSHQQDMVRTIKDSAWSIGAHTVAEQAGRTNQCLGTGNRRQELRMIKLLERRISEVNELISIRLSTI